MLFSFVIKCFDENVSCSNQIITYQNLILFKIYIHTYIYRGAIKYCIVLHCKSFYISRESITSNNTNKEKKMFTKKKKKNSYIINYPPAC